MVVAALSPCRDTMFDHLFMHFGHHDGSWPMGPHWETGMGAGGGAAGLLWALLGLVAIVAIVALGAYLAMQLARRPDSDSGSDALETLRRRYASGEIDDEEYEHRRRRLTDESG